MHPLAPMPGNEYFIYSHLLQWIDVIFKGNAFAYTLLAAFNIFFQALYLNRLCNKFRLFSRSGYVPALSYILFCSVCPAFSLFSLPLLLNWFILGTIDIISGFGQTLQPRKQIYNAGFLLCMAALFQFSAITCFLFLLICLILLRPFNISEWIVAMMGYFTPIYFAVCILFLMDRLDIIYAMPRLGISLPVRVEWRELSVISGLIILFFMGLYALQLQIAKINVYVRRNWSAFIIFLFISIAVAIFTDSAVKSAWLIVIPALSLIISNAFLLEKNKWFSNFAFYFSLLFVVYCQWALK